jgi:hypothetical protein
MTIFGITKLLIHPQEHTLQRASLDVSAQRLKGLEVSSLPLYFLLIRTSISN